MYFKKSNTLIHLNFYKRLDSYNYLSIKTSNLKVDKSKIQKFIKFVHTTINHPRQRKSLNILLSVETNIIKLVLHNAPFYSIEDLFYFIDQLNEIISNDSSIFCNFAILDRQKLVECESLDHNDFKEIKKHPLPTNFIIHQLYTIILSEYGLITKINVLKAIDKFEKHIVYFSKNRFMKNEFIFYKMYVHGCLSSNEEILNELSTIKKDPVLLDRTIDKLSKFR